MWVGGEQNFTKFITASASTMQQAEVHKVPEPANIVHRKFLEISTLAENFDQNARVENAEFVFHTIFSVQTILTENLHSYRRLSGH